MARNLLPLSHYEAEFVLLPEHPGDTRMVKAVRVVVHALLFPQRAIEPQLWVGKVLAQRTAIARNQRSIRGYFLEPPAHGQPIRVCYGDSLEGELDERFSRERIRPLPVNCGE